MVETSRLGSWDRHVKELLFLTKVRARQVFRASDAQSDISTAGPIYKGPHRITYRIFKQIVPAAQREERLKTLEVYLPCAKISRGVHRDREPV
jgi:hypothetical protein